MITLLSETVWLATEAWVRLSGDDSGRLDPVPADEDVTAGFIALGIFLALIAAVAVLGWSLSKHLKKARTNADAGMFSASAPKPPRAG